MESTNASSIATMVASSRSTVRSTPDTSAPRFPLHFVMVSDMAGT